jgi:enoyl-CoA hydratase/carnithine racemase
MSERVKITRERGIAEVRLSRPEKLNALDPEMFRAIAAAGDALSKDADVRAVVLHGEGRAFCAGLDLARFIGAAEPIDLLATIPGSIANAAQRVAWVWRELSVPVIAALHGVAFGGGLQIALGADIRYATRDTRLSVMEVKWGLIPDMSGTQTMRDLVRLDVAKELAFTGRVVEAEEALALGLLTRICDDPLAKAREVAGQIASQSPDAVRSAKRLLQTAWHAPPEEGLRLEAEHQRALLGSPNQIEAVQANFQKRAPRFV